LERLFDSREESAVTPTVQDETLVYRQNEHERELTVGTPAWFAWLETASTFSFVSEQGLFTARHERSGQHRGGRYWKAYRKQHGKLSSRYLGKSEALSLERLRAVAMAMADAPRGLTQSGDADSPVSSALPADHLLSPLLATKLHPPRPRNRLVSRSHLVEQLQQGMECALILVSAPAGFGKTTLLTQWLAERSIPIAWFSLEPEDNDPVRFLSYLIAALRVVDAHLCATALALLRMPQPPPPETVMALLSNDLMRSLTGEFALVLDDYHVITAEPIHRALTSLVEHMPPQMHLLIATRADPPLPLARLRARGQLTELRAAELRLRADEASAFLRAVMGLDLPPEAIVTLQSRTEGWITGLQLAALSLRGRTDVSEFLAAFTGSHRFVLDYLSEEVLARQEASVQAFLLHTAVLDRLSAPLCEVVTGQGGSQAMLEALEDANLFVVALDDERRWFRYHHLFAEVLRSHLLQAEPSLVRELHRRASGWYEQHGLVTEAVQHALAAPDIERAARLIEQHGIAVALRGQVHRVLEWLGRLPDALVRSHARLCLCHALMLMFTNQLEEVSVRLQDAERCVQADLSADEARAIGGWVTGVRANLALFSGDLARCVAFARQALDLLPETEGIMRVSARVGPAHAYLVSGDVRQEVEAQVAATAAPLRETGDLFALLTSLTLLARLQVLQGRLRQAATTYERAGHVVPEQEILRLLVGSAGYYFGRGDLLREWNDLDEASHSLARGMELVRGTLTVDATVVTLGYVALARVQQARGDFRGAIATLDAFAQVASLRHFVPHLLAHGLAVQAQVELAQGNLASAIRWANESGLSVGDDLSYPREREYLTLARVRLAQGKPDPADPFLQDALRLLDRLLEDAEVKARMGGVIEMLLLRALAFHVRGDRTDALTALERALVLTEPEGYMRLFIDEGAPMVALLRLAHARGMMPGYVATLLSATGSQAEVSSPRPGPLVEPPTPRELDVLRLLAVGLSNAAIARELVITVGTVKRHVNSIYSKLGVNSRTQAVARAHTLHLL
jgi:ATP/maltotriose-dependent transcriptional regulator MalT